jgi:uncharacterized repeat protein (TIGR01451 family)
VAQNYGSRNRDCRIAEERLVIPGEGLLSGIITPIFGSLKMGVFVFEGAMIVDSIKTKIRKKALILFWWHQSVRHAAVWDEANFVHQFVPAICSRGFRQPLFISIIVAACMLAHTVTAHAFGSTQCAASRKGSDLGCTAGDVSITGIVIAPGGPTSCIGGSTFPVDLDITVNFAVPDRWDIGIFLTNDGKDPLLLPANGGSAACSVGILPTTSPFANLDSNGGTDTCGDGSKSSVGGGTGSAVVRMSGVPVSCQAINMSGGKLYIPFVVSWDNQASPSGATCTSIADPVPNTVSKCNSPKTTVAAEVAYGTVNTVVLPTISKTNGITLITPGAATTYTVVISNTTGVSLSNAVFKDPAAANLTVSSVSCTAAGGATCPATTVAAMQGAGITIPAMPVNSSVTFTINATLAATPAPPGTGTVTNTASVTVSGQTNSASDTDTIRATITANNSLAPTSDDGTFNLLVGATTVAAAVGNGGTGSISVTPGIPVTVSETAAGVTNPAYYDTTYSCTGGISGSGTSVSITPADGQVISCTFTNTRKLPLLTVLKSASPFPNVNPGQVVTYTIQIINTGTGGATSVVAADNLSPYAYWGINSYGAGVAFQLTNGVPVPGLTLGTPAYSSDNGTTWSYTPVSGGGGAPVGYDGNVTNWRIPLSGTMNPNGANLFISYKVLVK